ncbi:MAG: hypothetical protein K0R84_2575 [Clostridia bacterium]|nr:hypothetical protein [Clostridia bacterium]
MIATKRGDSVKKVEYGVEVNMDKKIIEQLETPCILIDEKKVIKNVAEMQQVITSC